MPCKNSIYSRFSITPHRVDITVGGNFTVIFLAKGTLVHSRLKGTNLITKYGLAEWYCVIPNKVSYTNDETWAMWWKWYPLLLEKWGWVFSCVLSILLSICLNSHICTSKLCTENILFPWLVGIPHIWWLQVSRECYWSSQSSADERINFGK